MTDKEEYEFCVYFCDLLLNNARGWTYFQFGDELRRIVSNKNIGSLDFTGDRDKVIPDIDNVGIKKLEDFMVICGYVIYEENKGYKFTDKGLLVSSHHFNQDAYKSKLTSEHFIKKIAVETNMSLIEVNKSIKHTNSITEDWIKQQKKLTWWIMFATCVSAGSAFMLVAKEGFSIYKSQQEQSMPKKQTGVVDKTELKTEMKKDCTLLRNQNHR